MDLLSLVLYGDMDWRRVSSWLDEEPEDLEFSYTLETLTGSCHRAKSSKEEFSRAVIHMWNTGVYQVLGFVSGCAEKYFGESPVFSATRDKAACQSLLGGLHSYKELVIKQIGTDPFSLQCEQCLLLKQKGECCHRSSDFIHVPVTNESYTSQCMALIKTFSRVLGFLVCRSRVSYTVFVEQLQGMSNIVISSDSVFEDSEHGTTVDLFKSGLPVQPLTISKLRAVPSVFLNTLPALQYTVAFTAFHAFHLLLSQSVPIKTLFHVTMYLPLLQRAQVVSQLQLRVQPQQSLLGGSPTHRELQEHCKRLVFAVYYPKSMHSGSSDYDSVATGMPLPLLRSLSQHTQAHFIYSAQFGASTLASPFTSPNSSITHSPSVTPKPSVSPFITGTPGMTLYGRPPLVTNFSHIFPNALEQPIYNEFLPQVLLTHVSVQESRVTKMDQAFQLQQCAAMQAYMYELEVTDAAASDASVVPISQQEPVTVSQQHQLSTVESSLRRQRSSESKHELGVMDAKSTVAIQPRSGSVDALFTLLESLSIKSVPLHAAFLPNAATSELASALVRGIPRATADIEWWVDSLQSQLVLLSSRDVYDSNDVFPFISHEKLLAEVVAETAGVSGPLAEALVRLLSTSLTLSQSSRVIPSVSSLLGVLIHIQYSSTAVGQTLQARILSRVDLALTGSSPLAELSSFAPLLACICVSNASMRTKYFTIIDFILMHKSIQPHFPWVHRFIDSLRVLKCPINLPALHRQQKYMLYCRPDRLLCNAVVIERNSFTDAVSLQSSDVVSTQGYSSGKKLQAIELSSFDVNLGNERDSFTSRIKLPLPSSSSFSPQLSAVSHSELSPLIGGLSVEPTHMMSQMSLPIPEIEAIPGVNSHMFQTAPMTMYVPIRSSQILRTNEDGPCKSITETEEVLRTLYLHTHDQPSRTAETVLKEVPVCVLSGISSLSSEDAFLYRAMIDQLGRSTTSIPVTNSGNDEMAALLTLIADTQFVSDNSSVLTRFMMRNSRPSIRVTCSATTINAAVPLLSIPPIHATMKRLETIAVKPLPRVIVPQKQSSEDDVVSFDGAVKLANGPAHLGFCVTCPQEGAQPRIKALATMNPMLAPSILPLTELHTSLDAEMFLAVFEQTILPSLSYLFDASALPVSLGLHAISGEQTTVFGVETVISFFTALTAYGRLLGQACLQSCATQQYAPAIKAVTLFSRAATQQTAESIWAVSISSQLTQRRSVLTPLQNILEELLVQHNACALTNRLREREPSMKASFSKKAFSLYSSIIAFDSIPLTVDPHAAPLNMGAVTLCLTTLLSVPVIFHGAEGSAVDARASHFEELYKALGCSLEHYAPGFSTYTLSSPSTKEQMLYQCIPPTPYNSDISSVYDDNVWDAFTNTFYVHKSVRSHLFSSCQSKGKFSFNIDIMYASLSLSSPMNIVEVVEIINQLLGVTEHCHYTAQSHMVALLLQQKFNMDAWLLLAPHLSTLTTALEPLLEEVISLSIPLPDKPIWSSAVVSTLWRFALHCYALRAMCKDIEKTTALPVVMSIACPLLQYSQPGVYADFLRAIAVQLLAHFPHICTE